MTCRSVWMMRYDSEHCTLPHPPIKFWGSVIFTQLIYSQKYVRSFWNGSARGSVMSFCLLPWCCHDTSVPLHTEFVIVNSAFPISVINLYLRYDFRGDALASRRLLQQHGDRAAPLRYFRLSAVVYMRSSLFWDVKQPRLVVTDV